MIAKQQLKLWNRFTSSLALEFRNVSDLLGRKSQVELIWIPGHSVIEGSGIADEVARIVSDNMLNGPEPGIPVSLSALYSLINEWVEG